MLRTTYYYQNEENERGVTTCGPNFLTLLFKSTAQCNYTKKP